MRDPRFKIGGTSFRISRTAISTAISRASLVTVSVPVMRAKRQHRDQPSGYERMTIRASNERNVNCEPGWILRRERENPLKSESMLLD